MELETNEKTPPDMQLVGLWKILRTTFFIDSEGPKKRLDIQALRAFAVALVYSFHFLPAQFPNGYLGVDVFFVLSGYLMALVLSREKTIGIRNSLEFYYRRAKRIIPCFYLVVLFTIVTMTFVMCIPWLKSNSESGIVALMFRTNLENIKQDSDYFYQGRGDKYTVLFLHSWSLCVEMQFYIIVPFMFFVLKNIFQQDKLLCVITLMICAVASWSYNWSLSSSTVRQFNDPLSRVWQFIFGIVAFFISIPKDSEKRKLCVPRRLLTATILHISLVGCIFVGFLPIEFDAFTIRSMATSVTALGLVIGSHSQTILISNPVFTYIGDASYALYLTHWPILKMAKYYGKWHATDETYVLLGSLLLSVVSALLLHHFFEKKHLEWGKTANIVLSVGLFTVAYAFAMFSLPIGQELIGSNKEVVLANLELMHPSYMHEDATYRAFNGYGGAAPFGLATFPPGNGTLKVLVTGNSYAPQIMFAVKNVLAGRYKSLHLFSILGNQVIGAENSPKLGDTNFELARQLRPDVFIIATRLASWQKGVLQGKKDKRLLEGIMRMNQISQYCKHILIVGPHPYYPPGFLNMFMDRLQRNLPLDDMNLNKTEANKEMFNANLRFQKVVRRCKKCELISTANVFADREHNQEANKEMFNANLRFQKVVRRCKKCELISTANVFADREHNQYRLFDPVTKLAYTENTIHYTTKGIEAIVAAFGRLETFIQETENGTVTMKMQTNSTVTRKPESLRVNKGHKTQR